MSPTSILSQVDELEGRLRSLQEVLHHADRLATVGTVAAGVAHEVNNQLTPALAYAQILRSSRSDLTEHEQKAIDRVIAGIESASSILSAILELAAPPSSGEPARICEAIDRAVGCLGAPLERDRILLHVEVADDLSSTAPSQAVQQIILNLLINARKALQSTGGGKITISAQTKGRDVEIAVRDDGPGVPPSIRARLFEPFVTAPTAAGSPSGSGYGLGLAVCRRLTDQLAGRITAEHPKGGGAIFRVILPLADSLRRPADHPSRAARGTT